MNTLTRLLLFGGLASAPAFASLVFVTTPGGLGSNDSTNWSQLGPDQTALAGPFSATSLDSIGVTGNFGADNNGLVAVVCPASPSCSWTTSGTGMNGGDSDLWAFDNITNPQTGTGPITLTFGTSLLGAGLWIEGDTSGTFIAQLQVYNGGTLLGTSTTIEGTSDVNGDPVFLGALDTTADITKIVISLTSCPGCAGGIGDFAVDTLLMTDPGGGTTPEPSSVLLLSSGLAGMAWMLRKRSVKSARRSQDSLGNRRIF